MSKVPSVRIAALHAVLMMAPVFVTAQGCDSDPSPARGSDAGSADGGDPSDPRADSGPSSPGTLAAAGDGRVFCEKTIGHLLGTMGACCSEADKATSEFALGSGILGSVLPACIEVLEASIARQRLNVHADDAAACYGVYAERFGSGAKCGTLTTTYRDPAGTSCRNAFSGVQGAGEACAGDHECELGLTCVGYTATSEGACQVPPAVGAECGPGRTDGGDGESILPVLAFSNHPSCAAGAYCAEGTCAAQIPEGGECDAFGDEGDACAGSNVCVMRKCVAKLAGEGEPCGFSSDCERPLYCTEGTPNGTCQPLEPAGGTCTGALGFANECAGRCDAELGESGTCASFCGSP